MFEINIKSSLNLNNPSEKVSKLKLDVNFCKLILFLEKNGKKNHFILNHQLRFCLSYYQVLRAIITIYLSSNIILILCSSLKAIHEDINKLNGLQLHHLFIK